MSCVTKHVLEAPLAQTLNVRRLTRESNVEKLDPGPPARSSGSQDPKHLLQPVDDMTVV